MLGDYLFSLLYTTVAELPFSGGLRDVLYLVLPVSVQPG